jgi:cytochrome d ubiquinol oxidase subunit I
VLLPSLLSVDLARIQFAAVATYHFLFVPLTLGMTWILFAMEFAYLKTGNVVYKDMTQYWGKLFGINFALGVLTGLTMEFQFGTNWAYYSQYVGDIFGTPLAIEGLVAFMLESTFLGLFFFGWDKLSKKQHLFATFCLAIGSSMSALLILVANGYMQHPVGAHFNYETMRMETTNLLQLFLNPMAQIGFAHTILAGYVTGAVFVMGISSYFLLKGRDIEFAKRSFAIAAGFGLITSIMLAYVGDANGVAVFKNQPEKLAAIEGEWTTQPAPANFNLIAWPDQAKQKNDFALQIPGVLGLIVTHSKNEQIPGLQELAQQNEAKIRDGLTALNALDQVRQGDKNPALMNTLNQYQDDLGYGMLLEQITPDLKHVTNAQIHQAAQNTIPNVWILFWTFRVMIALGILMLLMFIVGFAYSVFKKAEAPRWVYRWALYSIPFPFLACMAGWFVTEHGRQPWTIYGVLPTDISSSSLNAADIAASFAIFILLYTGLLIVEMYLMFKFARKGPSSIHTGRYHFEQAGVEQLKGAR